MDLEQFNRMVVDYLVETIPEHANVLRKLGAGDELLESGAIDSHRYIEMCLYIEERTGIPIDIAELEPEEISTIAGLHSVVARG